jgi:hypothetical protein
MESLANSKTPAEEERRIRLVKHLNHLKKKKDFKQKSDEWLAKRKLLITASEAACVIPAKRDTCQIFFDDTGCSKKEQEDILARKFCAKYDTLNTFIKRKTNWKPFTPVPATEWGVRFEEEGRRIYENIKKARVCEFGLHVHGSIKWLGASPDGITDDAEKEEDLGVVVEIKCPFSRVLKEVPPFEYWIQVQIVMEVFDLPAADLIQLKFALYQDEDDYLADTLRENQVKGVHIELSPDQCIYSPRTIEDPKELLEWAHIVVDELPDDDYKKIVCWKLEEYTLNRIRRRADWLQTILPYMNHAHRRIRLTEVSSVPEIDESPKKIMKIDIAVPERSAPLADIDICGGSSDEDGV